jgi:signal peptidase I
MNYFKKRKVLKTANEILKQCRYFRNMREDLLAPEILEKLVAAEKELVEAIRAKDLEAICGATGALHDMLAKLCEGHHRSAWGENIEVLIVAFIAAMGIKAYFFQPFKIPTGSMQPTLYGITAKASDAPTVFDNVPLKYAKWFATGDWYREVKVTKDGHLGEPYGKSNDPANYYHMIAGHEYKIPNRHSVPYAVGSLVKAGSVLWSGHISAGDHLFVNRMAWNFGRPQRGDIMVFSTRGILGIRRQDTFYIKRLVAKGGEQISIRPPHVLIGGKVMMESEGMRKVSTGAEPGYWGYRNGGKLLFDPSVSYQVPEKHYFALGDNTLSSEDGRFWGSVPQANMVGPSFFVYWPFTKRWGFSRR